MATADPGPERDSSSGDASPPGRPLWVNVFAAVAIVVFVVFVVVHLLGGGFRHHGP